MGIRPFRTIPANVLEWEDFFAKTQVAPTAGTVTDGSFANRTPHSVLGRATGTNGAPADIVLATDQFLINRAGTLQGGTIVDADIPSAIARDTEVTNGDNAVTLAFQNADAAHVAAADPHPGYVLESTILNGSATYDPASLGDAVGATTTVSVTGAAMGDFALASFSLDLQGITVTAWVSAVDTVSVRFQNESGGTLDLGSGTLRARVWKQ